MIEAVHENAAHSEAYQNVEVVDYDQEEPPVPLSAADQAQIVRLVKKVACCVVVDLEGPTLGPYSDVPNRDLVPCCERAVRLYCGPFVIDKDCVVNEGVQDFVSAVPLGSELEAAAWDCSVAMDSPYF